MGNVKRGGGWHAVRYAFDKARDAGGLLKMYQALRLKNACKTCALGMGGQHGGMVDESGHFPEVCKKSIQAMAADMQPGLEPGFFEQHSISELRSWSPRELEHAGRLAHPLLAGRGDTHYQPISWADAIERIAASFRQAQPDDCFFYASGRASNEAAFLLQLFARLFGTNNVNNCSYYCHQASGVGIGSALGTGTATITLDDLQQCDLLFLIGGNPASNHPRLMRQLMHIRRRGGSVVVINPIRETGLLNFAVPSDPISLLFGTDIASDYLQPHIGGDIALLLSIAKCIDELDGHDRGYIRAYTEGWEQYIDYIRSLAWSDLVRASGVSHANISRVAKTYKESEHCVFAWTMGITHHLHGADNVRAIVNLALMRGMVGKPGCGLLPIRGHSNVQGVGSVGVTPALKEALFNRLQDYYGVTLPTTPGLDTLGCMQSMAEGHLKHGWCLGGNLYGANPDAAWARSCFSKLDSIVYVSTTLNTGHAHGCAQETLILPALPRDEESQATSQESMFNYVRLSDGGPQRLDGPRSEVEIIAAVAEQTLGRESPINWQEIRSHDTIRQAIATIVPGFDQLKDIGRTKEEFQITGRTFHRPLFHTPSGRARFHVTHIPEFEEQEGTLRLMTIRSEGQFNTVVYEEQDLYRHQDRRNVILMNTSDIARLSLVENQRVSVLSSVGRLGDIIVRPFEIRPGNCAMYYPEANVLVPRDADPESRTPAFKHVSVTIQLDEAILQ